MRSQSYKADTIQCKITSLGGHCNANVLLKTVAPRLGNYCKAGGTLCERECDFRPAQSAADMLFAVRRLQELKRVKYQISSV